MLNKPTIKQVSRNVLNVSYENISAGWEAWVLLVSDAHHDSVYCKRDLEKKHLDMAKERGAMVFHAGDTFDAMQGKFDPRRSLSNVRPEDASVDYYNKIVDHAVEDYAPYADNIGMFAKGNHETAVLDKTNTCLISNLVKDINKHTSDGHMVYPGGYGGWIKFKFRANKTRQNSINLKYNHGAGGAAPVTRGVIQTNRQAVFLPDADVVWNGHNHQGYIMPLARERLTTTSKIIKDLCWFVRTPGYQDSYADGHEGYIVEKNSGPTPNGAIWLRFYLDGKFVRCQPLLEIE